MPTRKPSADEAKNQAVAEIIIKDGDLHGMIFFHGGDDSAFVARKKGKARPKKKS